ncbi:MAG: enoyl-CoA hydratase-related protein [Flavobacteriales bacterium]|jgi:enoyl-CoA hydratase|nr:enoyl-CoA hydratase-related protein [Flavobacteriales bacterium]
MNYNNLLISIEDHIGTITINRPKKLNALNKETISELHEAFKSLASNDEVKAIILTGAGEKAFVAGADISEFANFSVEQGEELSRVGHESLFTFVEKIEKPILAAVNGFALGGGLELAMSCHIRVFSSHARVGLPEVSLGVIPGYGGTQRLAQIVGRGKAIEMIATAGMIDAEHALHINLANHVVSPDELMDETRKMASKIIKNSSTAIAAALRCVQDCFDKNTDGFETEIKEFGKAFGTPDFKEGTTAFLEKRKPKFQ